MNRAYGNEVRRRWGDTEAYGEYAEKTKHYTKEQWSSATQKLDDIFLRFAQCKSSGASTASETAQALVIALQRCITEYFYHCTDEILYGLGQMYVADERFRKNIDRHAEGTALYVYQAIACGREK